MAPSKPVLRWSIAGTRRQKARSIEQRRGLGLMTGTGEPGTGETCGSLEQALGDRDTHSYNFFGFGHWVKLRMLPRGAGRRRPSATGFRNDVDTVSGHYACLPKALMCRHVPWWARSTTARIGSTDRPRTSPIIQLFQQPYNPTNPESVHPPLHDRAADPLPCDEVGHEPVPARAVPLQARAEALAGQLH